MLLLCFFNFYRFSGALIRLSTKHLAYVQVAAAFDDAARMMLIPFAVHAACEINLLSRLTTRTHNILINATAAIFISMGNLWKTNAAVRWKIQAECFI